MDKVLTKKGESTRQKLLEVGEALILERGYGGTSLNDILNETGLTKGAFFHYFKNKDELALAVLDNYLAEDLAAFEDFTATSEKLADNPLQEILIFLKLFEEYLESLDAPPPGCVLAAYTYEHTLLDKKVRQRVTVSFKEWQGYYENKVEKLIAWRKPKIDVTVTDLAQTIMAILQGGFLISRAYSDKTMTIRLSAQYRNYLNLLFGE